MSQERVRLVQPGHIFLPAGLSSLVLLSPVNLNSLLHPCLTCECSLETPSPLHPAPVPSHPCGSSDAHRAGGWWSEMLGQGRHSGAWSGGVIMTREERAGERGPFGLSIDRSRGGIQPVRRSKANSKTTFGDSKPW